MSDERDDHARSRRCKRWLVASLLVAAGARWPLAAQVLPQSSGNSWFYSPQHFNPFAGVPRDEGKAPRDEREAEIAPPRDHHHHHHHGGGGGDGEPC